MPNNVTKGALLSSCRQYRYVLWRIWDTTKPTVMFICLNPSTADEQDDDKTVIRCINFAKSWGYGGLYMTNLFAYRSTDKSILYSIKTPIGEQNDSYIFEYTKKADKVIAAWGNDGCHLNRSQCISQLIPHLFCLEINQTGEPKHPLYANGSLTPKPYTR